MQSQSEAHLLPLRASIQRVLEWNVEHSNILRAEPLECATTRCVIRLAGHPEGRHLMLLCQRDNHAAGSLGVLTATVSGLHHVSNVPGIADHVLIPAHPEADPSDLFAAGKLHFESVRRDTPGTAVGRHSLGEDELQIAIRRERRIKKFECFRRWHRPDAREKHREAALCDNRTPT